MKPESIHREAHALMKNPKVAAMVEQLTKEADQQFVRYLIGRSDRIWTYGPRLPKTVLYQAELHSVRFTAMKKTIL